MIFIRFSITNIELFEGLFDDHHGSMQLIEYYVLWIQLAWTAPFLLNKHSISLTDQTFLYLFNGIVVLGPKLMFVALYI